MIIRNQSPKGGTELQFNYLEKYVDKKLLDQVQITTSVPEKSPLHPTKINILWQKNSYDQPNLAPWFEDKSNHHKYDWYVFNSHWTFEKFRVLFNLPLEKCLVIKNGVEKYILSVSENGFGKRSSDLDYRVTNRGGKGIIGIINSPRNGNIAATLVVDHTDEIILSTDKGSIMRCAVKEIRVAGRNTQGVRIKKLSGSEKVVSVIKIEDNII